MPGLDPIVAPNARVLILGSFPGEQSLRAGRYYAHPQNAFWPIMEALFGVAVECEYAARVAMLQAAEVALWDVLQAVERAGSLDAKMVPGSEVVNDFNAFFAAHPAIRAVFCNGDKAAKLYRRFVQPALLNEIPMVCLPSTSPANTRLSREAKIEQWKVIKEVISV